MKEGESEGERRREYVKEDGGNGREGGREEERRHGRRWGKKTKITICLTKWPTSMSMSLPLDSLVMKWSFHLVMLTSTGV